MNLLTRIEGPKIKVTVTTATIPAYSRAKIAADGGYVAAGATEIGDVITEQDIAPGGDDVLGYIFDSAATKWGIASGAISCGDILYAAANGAVSSTQATGAPIVGRAKGAAVDTAVVEYFSHRSVA